MSAVRHLRLIAAITGLAGALALALPTPPLAAQTGAATPNYTQTVETLFNAALTATAQATPPASLNLEALAVVETRAVDLYYDPARTSSYLAPSGERFAHFDGQ